MICKNCGNNIPDDAVFCANCGAPVETAQQANPTCANCGAALEENAVFCANCGAPTAAPQQPAAPTEPGPSKMLCGFMAIFLGWIGIHDFILGNKKRAIRNIILYACGAVTCLITSIIAVIFGIVDGIKIFKGVINTDAHGRKLS